MKRILIGYVIDGKHSGIDTYILNIIDQISAPDVQIDCLTSKVDPELKKRLQEKNAGLIQIPTLKRPRKQYLKIRQIIRENAYDIAYFNVSEAFNCMGVLAAYKEHVKKVVVHSHSSGVDEVSWEIRMFRTFCHNIMKHLVLGHCATDYYACSHKAGEWLYPKKVIQNNGLQVMNNAVKTERFRFDENVRIKKRNELGITDQKVIGHIGSFSYAKNTRYLIEIAKELKKRSDNIIIVMVGSGKYFEAIELLIKEYDLQDTVKLLGIRQDVNELIQAMDMFVLPSRFEGLPIVAIEAQISGLKTILSENISKEAALSDKCLFHRIDCPASEWADLIIDELNYDRKQLDLSNCNYCFDIREQQKQIDKIFQIL